ncbi:membrane-bound lytic murein transglycosylase MltF [Methylophaga sp.]|uniref:membrane-bound lytic murein transglycosylase MltF n=1 Tax=Methylophaga sp. TaxID=2024840 RepID=UPI003F6A4BB8
MDIYKVLIFSVILFFVGCSSESNQNQQSRTFEQIEASGELRIVTRNAPTTWYINAQGDPTGFEYDLANIYSEHLGLEPTFIVKDSIYEIFQALQEGEADVAGAGLTNLQSRNAEFLVGPQYDSLHQVLVCHRDGFNPEGYDELSEVSISVIADSSYAERLNEIKQRHNPTLEWQETDNHSTEELLEKVARKKVDCTVSDSTIVEINRRYFPELRVMMQLTDLQSIVLYLPSEAKTLQGKLKKWFQQFEKTVEMDKLEDRYYGYFREFDYVDVSVMKRRIDNRLPKYKKYFKAASNEYDLPLLTVMAQAYQESHWDPEAVSPTGVKGIMMLTQNTAKSLGINERTDPKQSILGGVKYLKKMYERFKPEIESEDRLYLALAAYNVGRAHMHDAQSLARDLGKSPYHWHDMKEVLPLLSQKKYYKKLKYGYARGTEPVRYVQRIREYQHILENELN